MSLSAFELIATFVIFEWWNSCS